jgi:hypothetical protein
MLDTLDKPTYRVEKRTERSVFLGFLSAISWVYSGLFVLFLWYLMDNLVDMVAPYSIWEVGGYLFDSFYLEFISLIGAGTVVLATFLVFYEKFWGLIPYVGGQVVFMYPQVNHFIKAEYHDSHAYTVLLLWTILPLLLIILLSIFFLVRYNQSKKSNLAA